jgi:hypothetical protein
MTSAYHERVSKATNAGGTGEACQYVEGALSELLPFGILIDGKD